jgi:hypothetical protein
MVMMWSLGQTALVYEHFMRFTNWWPAGRAGDLYPQNFIDQELTLIHQ